MFRGRLEQQRCHITEQNDRTSADSLMTDLRLIRNGGGHRLHDGKGRSFDAALVQDRDPPHQKLTSRTKIREKSATGSQGRKIEGIRNCIDAVNDRLSDTEKSPRRGI
jgi:hypothetical protein